MLRTIAASVRPWCSRLLRVARQGVVTPPVWLDQKG